MEKPKFSSLYGNDFLDHLYEATWSETHEKTALYSHALEKKLSRK